MTMNTYTTRSHNVALAIALQDDADDAEVSTETVHSRARPGDLEAAAEHAAKVDTVQRALLILMRENACNDADAVMRIRTRAAQHRLTIVDVATSINELDDAS